MEVTAKYPGSFGEILQGNLGEKPVLVSSPIIYIHALDYLKAKKKRISIETLKQINL